MLQKRAEQQNVRCKMLRVYNVKNYDFYTINCDGFHGEYFANHSSAFIQMKMYFGCDVSQEAFRCFIAAL